MNKKPSSPMADKTNKKSISKSPPEKVKFCKDCAHYIPNRRRAARTGALRGDEALWAQHDRHVLLLRHARGGGR